MSATIGRRLRRTISLSASPARLSGTATRAISQPTSCGGSTWRIVASTSCVSVVHMDCTETGAPSPIAVPPTQTRFDFRRGRGPTRSSGRFRSTLIALMEQVYGREPSRTRNCSAIVTGLRFALAAAILISCGVDMRRSSPSASTSAQPSAPSVRLTADDDLCARRTFDALIAAVNASDEARLASLFGGSFQWLGVTGAASYEVRGAVEALAVIGRSG